MSLEVPYSPIHTQFGIDDIYVHEALDFSLLKKLQQRAEISLDVSNRVILKHVDHDMILIFHHKLPSQSLIYRFLERLNQDASKKEFFRSHKLLNEDELFAAIKSQKFILVTHRDLT